jgi:transposase
VKEIRFHPYFDTVALDELREGAITEAMNTQEPFQPSSRNEKEPTLFVMPASEPAEPELPGQPRLRRAERQQVVMHVASLDSLLAEDHRARLVWEYVQGLDLGALYEPIRAVEGTAGRNAIDPRILLALWLYATLDGVGSARQLARLCEDHVAYRWICGGVSVNYHTLSDFRTAHPAFLDELLTQSAATLMHEGLVSLHRVAQDGMRVRASAGAASFRRRATLEECQTQAREQVETLRQEIEADPAAGTRRQQAARQRAARERSERVAQALGELAEIEAKKQGEKKDKARASTTDPEARVMKMGDGGFRPAHNVQFATDTASQVITGVEVVNAGSDAGQMPPMIEQHQQRYGQTPEEALVDGGFAQLEDIEEVSSPDVGTTVYAPVQKPRKEGRDPYLPLPSDSATIAEWRQRMGTPQAKEIYKERAATAECVNAISRNRGLRQFLVRGLVKVRTVALWFAIAHNLMRAVALRAQAALAMVEG